MILVTYSGGLGDHFFQYCYARSLSQRLNYRLKAHAIPGLPGTHKELGGLEVYWPLRRVSPAGMDHFIEESRPHPVGVQLRGSWQNLDVARASSGMWQDWLMEEALPVRPGSLGLCWGVGQGANHEDCGFDPEWLKPLLEVFTPGELVIATQSSRAPECGGFVPCPVTHVQGESIENLKLLAQCERLIVGTSAFDQMAGVMTMSEIVYYNNPSPSSSSQTDIPCPIKATQGRLNGKKKWIDFSQVSSTT